MSSKNRTKDHMGAPFLTPKPFSCSLPTAARLGQTGALRNVGTWSRYGPRWSSAGPSSPPWHAELGRVQWQGLVCHGHPGALRASMG